jgi:hypothetical protein
MDSADKGLEIESPPPVVDAGLRALYEYWRVLGAQAAGLPPLAAFDPLRLPRLLPNIWVIEGENINAIYRRNIGRKFFAEVFEPDDMPGIVQRYGRALSEPAVYYATGYIYAAAGQYCVGERLGLPMLGSDGGTRILLGATYYGHRVDDHVALRPAGATAQFHAIRAANHRAVAIANG